MGNDTYPEPTWTTASPSSPLTTNKHSQAHADSVNIILIASCGVAILVMIISAVLICKRYRLCVNFRFARQVRRRLSSTGSSKPLETGTLHVEHRNSTRPVDSTLFSINEDDNGDEEYYYDEMFDKSAFEDARVSQLNKQLTAFDDEDDVPDLSFKYTKY